MVRTVSRLAAESGSGLSDSAEEIIDTTSATLNDFSNFDGTTTDGGIGNIAILAFIGIGAWAFFGGK